MANCLSIAEFTMDGTSTGPFAFTFPLLPITTIAVTPQIAVFMNTALLVVSLDYIVNEGNKTVTLLTTPTLDDILSIRRVTRETTRYIDFTNGAVISEQILDLDSNQLFFLIQENFCKLENTLTLLGNCWNGEGKEACNFAPGLTNTSLTTLGQVLNLLQGFGSTTVGATHYVTATADGVETDFNYNSFGLSKAASVHDLFVTVDNVLQDSGAAYTSLNVAGSLLVRFTVAPVLGAVVTIRSLTGSVVATSQPGSIPGQNLIDGTVDIGKLFDNIEAGSEWDASGGTIFFVATEANASPLPESTLLKPKRLTASLIQGFNTKVRAENKITQLALPTFQLNMNNQKITGLSMGPGVGSVSDATNRGFVNTAIAAAVNVNPTFQLATAFTSIEASVRGGSGDRPRTGTVVVPWPTHPGPLQVRVFANYTGENVDYPPGNEFNNVLWHYDQPSNLGGNPFGGDALASPGNGWLGDYDDPTGFKTLVEPGGSNFAGYRINNGFGGVGALYLWLNVTTTQIEWELADEMKLPITPTAQQELFQFRMVFWRKN